MILSQKVKVNISNMRKYYEEKGYKINGKKLEIFVKDLKPNSLKEIKVRCDFCNKEKKLRYQDYQKATNYQKEYYYCKNCKYIKYKNTIMEKYNVDNISQLNFVKKKKININLKKYGVENPSQFIDFKIKKEKTSLKNYGVSYPSQNKNFLIKKYLNALKIKNYKNTEIYYQGSYEKDFLDTYYDRLNIKNGFTIKYNMNGKELYYLPDFYLPYYNLIVEIKSIYWYEINKERCLFKEKAVKDYNYCLILDKNYKDFEHKISYI